VVSLLSGLSFLFAFGWHFVSFVGLSFLFGVGWHFVSFFAVSLILDWSEKLPVSPKGSPRGEDDVVVAEFASVDNLSSSVPESGLRVLNADFGSDFQWWQILVLLHWLGGVVRVSVFVNDIPSLVPSFIKHLCMCWDVRSEWMSKDNLCWREAM